MGGQPRDSWNVCAVAGVPALLRTCRFLPASTPRLCTAARGSHRRDVAYIGGGGRCLVRVRRRVHIFTRRSLAQRTRRRIY